VLPLQRTVVVDDGNRIRDEPAFDRRSGRVSISGPAKAAEHPSKPIGRYSCADIRAVVALFSSVEAAVKAARAAGVSEGQIVEALRCLTTAR